MRNSIGLRMQSKILSKKHRNLKLFNYSKNVKYLTGKITIDVAQIGFFYHGNSIFSQACRSPTAALTKMISYTTLRYISLWLINVL